MHIYDLAEEFGLPVEDVKKWLKAKGFGTAERLTVAAVEAFKSQHRSSVGALSFERLMLGNGKENENSKAKIKHKEPKKWVDKPSVDEAPKEINPLMLEAVKQIDQPGTRISAMAKGAVIPKPIPITPVKDELALPDLPDMVEKEVKINDLLSQRQNRWQSLRPNKALDQSETPSEFAQSMAMIDHPNTGKTSIQQVKQQQIEQFYQKQYEKLLEQYRVLQEENQKKEQERHQQRKEIDTLQKSLHQLQKGRPMPVQVVLPPSAEENHKQGLWNYLAAQGFDQWTAISILQQVLLHPIQGAVLLHQLKHQNPSQIFSQLQLCCEHDICREISLKYKSQQSAQSTKYLLSDQEQLLFVPAHLCPICQGSDHRRHYVYLQQSLLASSLSKKIIVVGGLDDPHHSIKQLNHELPGIEWLFIAGSDSIDQSRANQKVQSAAIVVIWPTDHLPHSLSNSFKSASQHQAIPLITMAPGQRSVVNIVQNIMQKLELGIV